MKQKFLLAGLMLLFSLSLSAETYSGTCGDNLKWKLSTETGILTISGKGAMTDYSSSSDVPWNSYRSSIVSAVISNGVTSIGEDAFFRCSSLTSVTIPNSVTSIGDDAFYDCSSLTSVTIPNSVTSIGSSTFVDVPNIVYTGSATGSPWGARSVNGYVDGYLVFSDATKTKLLACSAAATGEITIPNSVTSIGRSAFRNCSSLTSITIPNSVTSIGDWAFVECRSLTSITIPNSVTSIGNFAFLRCSSLTSVTIPNSVTSIGEGAFSGVPNIVDNGTATGSPWGARSVNGYVDGYLVYSDATKTKLLACSSAATGEITIPNSVISIERGAFDYCSSLTSIEIPNSVTSIGRDAFYYCSSLTSITIPNSVTSIGNNAFSYCSGLTSITIPNSVTSIGDFAFCYCSSLTSVTIPNSVTSIGDAAFGACSSLTSVTIPNSVTSIGEYAFSYCSSLTSIEIPNSVTSIGDYAFAYCSSLTSVTIPNSVTSIGDYAFAYCSSLTSAIIGDNVESIGKYVFYGCETLTTLTIGKNVTNFEEKAFYGCSNLTSIYNYREKPAKLGENVFNVDYFNCTLYVLAESVGMYKSQGSDWKDLCYNILPIGANTTTTDNVDVVPTDHTADIVWPTISGAASYELVIRNTNGDIICTLVFNAEGQLTSITFNAPGRDNAPDNVQTAGFSFTVSGLDAGTTYNYTLTAKDSGGNTLDTRTGSFKTAGTATAVEETEGIPAVQTRKVMRDGVICILMPDGKMYDAQGVEVK